MSSRRQEQIEIVFREVDERDQSRGLFRPAALATGLPAGEGAFFGSQAGLAGRTC
jgi:hypothetical protein